jgi:hypothetical protein
MSQSSPRLRIPVATRRPWANGTTPALYAGRRTGWPPTPPPRPPTPRPVTTVRWPSGCTAGRRRPSHPKGGGAGLARSGVPGGGELGGNRPGCRNDSRPDGDLARLRDGEPPMPRRTNRSPGRLTCAADRLAETPGPPPPLRWRPNAQTSAAWTAKLCRRLVTTLWLKPDTPRTHVTTTIITDLVAHRMFIGPDVGDVTSRPAVRRTGLRGTVIRRARLLLAGPTSGVDAIAPVVPTASSRLSSRSCVPRRGGSRNSA